MSPSQNSSSTSGILNKSTESGDDISPILIRVETFVPGWLWIVYYSRQSLSRSLSKRRRNGTAPRS